MKRIKTSFYTISAVLFITVFSSCLHQNSTAKKVTEIDVTKFGIKPDSGENALFAIKKAINYAKSIKGGVLIKFPTGRYHFSADSSLTKTYYESNTTDNNPKNLAVLIENLKDITIDGNGSQFIFSGAIQPFTIDHSKNITLKNINIDWDIPITAQAKVVSTNNREIEIEIDTAQYPFLIKNNWLYFICSDKTNPVWRWSIMEYDADQRIIVPQTGDYGSIRAVDNKFTFNDKGNGIVVIKGNFKRVPAVGNYLILRHGARDHAGIFIWQSQNITLENINVYHAAGLGCLSQYSKNLNFNNVNFIPNRKKNRYFSGHDDGFQISNCSGQVNISGCKFEGLMDDPVNVHGTSVKIIEIRDDNTLKCRFEHDQSMGMIWAHPGDEVNFIENQTMVTVSRGIVKTFKALNRSEFLITFKNTIPKNITAGDALENLTYTPSVNIKNCVFGSCRARGLLVTTPKKVVIENNVFLSSGSAILIAGDANIWYESGAVTDVVIRNNTFEAPCLTSLYQFCEAVISIYPEIPELDYKTPFHKNITIENNVFHPFDYPVLYAKSVENITFSHNKLVKSNKFKPFHGRKFTLSFEACKNVKVFENGIEGEVLGKNILLEKMPENQISAQNDFKIIKK